MAATPRVVALMAGVGVAEELEFFKALEAVLYPLTTASSLLRVVDRADREGVLRQLRDGADVADLANVTGRSNESARALCRAGGRQHC